MYLKKDKERKNENVRHNMTTNPSQHSRCSVIEGLYLLEYVKYYRKKIVEKKKQYLFFLDFSIAIFTQHHNDVNGEVITAFFHF